jgi:DNA polymerase III alpha subunit
MSGCLKGEIPYRIGIGDIEGAKAALQQYQDILGKRNFYIEIMRLGLKQEERVHKELIKLANEFDAPLVATNDCHYFYPDDYKAHQMIIKRMMFSCALVRRKPCLIGSGFVLKRIMLISVHQKKCLSFLMIYLKQSLIPNLLLKNAI